MRRAIIHIGMHKTGTTTIQSTLAANRDNLLSHGIAYPKAGTIDTGGHLNLAYEALGSWKYNRRLGGWSEATTEVLNADADCVIISAETFSGYRDKTEIIDSIKQFCSEIGASPEIIAYVRPQFLYLDSLYAQNASTGYESRKFSDYILVEGMSQRHDYEWVFSNWFDAFEKVSIFGFNPKREVSITHQFLEAASLEAVSITDEPGKKLNTRATTHAVEYARKATEILSPLLPISVRHKVLSSIRDHCASKMPKSPAFSGMTKDVANTIQERFADTNWKFEQERMVGRSLDFPSADSMNFQQNILDLDFAGKPERDRFTTVLASALIQTETKVS